MGASATITRNNTLASGNNFRSQRAICSCVGANSPHDAILRRASELFAHDSINYEVKRSRALLLAVFCLHSCVALAPKARAPRHCYPPSGLVSICARERQDLIAKTLRGSSRRIKQGAQTRTIGQQHAPGCLARVACLWLNWLQYCGSETDFSRGVEISATELKILHHSLCHSSASLDTS